MLKTMRTYGKALVTGLRQEWQDAGPTGRKVMVAGTLAIAGVLGVCQYEYGKPIPGVGNPDLSPPPSRVVTVAAPQPK